MEMTKTKNSRIKVFHLLTSLGMGGAENGVVNLLNHLDQNLFEPGIITFSDKGPLESRINRQQVQLINIPKKEGNDLSLIPRLYRLFKQLRPHIIHTHFWGTLVEGVLPAKMARVPVVIHGEHGTLELRKPHIWIQRFFWGWCNQVLSISTALKYRMSHAIGYNPDKILAIINGVNIEKFYPNVHKRPLREQFHIPSDAFVVGTVGRLLPVKDQKTLLKAVSLFKKKRKDPIVAVIAGEGPLFQDLQQTAVDLGIEKETILLGRQDDIPSVMNLMDIFVLSSISEGISNTILEAMACGLPIIATAVGGTPEIVDETYGLLIPPSNEERLVVSMIRLIDDLELRKQFAINARSAAVTRFSLASMVQTYENLYGHLLQRHS